MSESSAGKCIAAVLDLCDSLAQIFLQSGNAAFRGTSREPAKRWHPPRSQYQAGETCRRPLAPRRPAKAGSRNRRDMSTTYRELLAQRRDLDARIEAAKQVERTQAIATIRELMEQFGIEASDLPSKRGAGRGPAPARYRDPVSGATWNGRGRKPLWIVGKDRRDFEI